MRVLARSDAGSIQALLAKMALPPHSEMRTPESGLVMLRGRISGSGAPFNFGEATITRAAVRLQSGEVGISYILGRDRAKARSAALIDALVQSDTWRATIQNEIVAPLESRLAAMDAMTAAKTAATRVDFFTLVRGED